VINDVSLPKFVDATKQNAVQFLYELDSYFSLKHVPESPKLHIVSKAIWDSYAKQWLESVRKDLKNYSEFKIAFTELLWNTSVQAQVRGAAAISLQEESHEEQHSVRLQLAQLTQAVATLQSQVQQAMPLPQSPRAQRQRMATPDSASRRRLLSPEPDIDWDTTGRIAYRSSRRPQGRQQNLQIGQRGASPGQANVRGTRPARHTDDSPSLVLARLATSYAQLHPTSAAPPANPVPLQKEEIRIIVGNKTVTEQHIRGIRMTSVMSGILHLTGVHLLATIRDLMLGLHGDTLEIRVALTLHCSSIGTVYTTTDFEL
jgi:hypothetical protein